jgi:hypothetical protein
MSNETEKLNEIVEPDTLTVCGHELRKFTGGTVGILQKIKCPLIDPVKVAEGIEDILYNAMVVFYLHTIPICQARREIKDMESFEDNVWKLMDSMTIEQQVEAANSIQDLIKGSTIGSDYQAEDGGSAPN